MEKINAIIIDDEIKNIRLLKYYLNEFCGDINVIAEATSFEEGIKALQNNNTDILFLDIQLKDKTGFDLLDCMLPQNVKVIFVTSHEKYALKAFKYNAVDYILKPIVTEELILAVNRVKKDIQKKIFTSETQINSLNKTINDSLKQDFIAIPSNDRIELIKFKDIIFLESQGRYTIFHCTNNTQIIASRNLGDYDDILDNLPFFRTHKSYIININHTSKIIKNDGFYCKMNNNKNIPVARRRQEILNRVLGI